MPQLARIFVMPRSAMQSGRGRSQGWTLAYEPGERQRLDPLMGWAGSGDTNAQVSLNFDSKEDAIAYAEANGLAYDVEQPNAVRIKSKVYAANLRFGRPEDWKY